MKSTEPIFDGKTPGRQSVPFPEANLQPLQRRHAQRAISYRQFALRLDPDHNDHHYAVVALNTQVQRLWKVAK